MTVTIEGETTMEGQDNLNFNISPSDYGCDILQEKTDLLKANDKSLPNDARLVYYTVDNVDYIDLTRGRKIVDIFDMYYDRYGPGAVKKISFGFGQVSPKLWGYKSKEQSKKKK